jgi:hypothetical protein
MNVRKMLALGMLGGGGVDTTRPTVAITSAAATITAAAFTVTVTFSEAVVGFDNTKITVVNGSAGAVSGSGPYTSVITPTATGTVTVTVADGAVTDGAGNTNTVSNTFSILYIAASLWMIADDIAGADGDAISAWASHEGNAYSFAQTSTKRPLLKKAANGINGHNTALFDGSNDILVYAGTGITNSSQGTIFAIYRLTDPIAANSQEILASGDEAGTSYYCIPARGCQGTTTRNVSNIQKNNDTEDYIRGNATLSTATSYLGMWMSTGTATSMRVNGTLQTLTVVTGANNGDWWGDTSNRDNFTIGGVKLSVETNILKGDIAEIIMLDTSIAAGVITAIETYLATKYGITLP